VPFTSLRCLNYAAAVSNDIRPTNLLARKLNRRTCSSEIRLRTIAWLLTAAREPISNFAHDFIDLMGLQEMRILCQLVPPSHQDPLFAGFLWIVIGFLNHLLDGHFPVFQLHRRFLEFAVLDVPIASPQRTRVSIHLFDHTQFWTEVAADPVQHFFTVCETWRS
jgi:hypothetical protein